MPVLRISASAFVLATWLWASAMGFADEPFLVIAPDAGNKQLLSVSVQPTADGIEIRQQKSLNLPFAPTGVALQADGRRLIVTSSAKGGPTVAAIAVDEKDELRIIRSSKLPHPAGYTSVDRSGRYLMTAHYVTGTIAVYRIDDDGSVGADVCTITTPNKEAHCVLTTLDNQFAYIPCVKNNNALYQFAFDETTGQLSPMDKFDASPPAMFGPRHVAYHPTLPIAYFSNEQQLGVSVYEIGPTGQLTDRQHAATMPRRTPFEQGKRDLHASDLVITPDGRRLFVAVRDFNGDEDSVFAFRVEADGRLSLRSRTMVGDIPWKLDLSPDGKYLLVSEAFEGRLSILAIGNDALLTVAGQVDWNAQVRDMVVAKAK